MPTSTLGFVVNNGDDTVSVFDIATGFFHPTTIPVASQPVRCAMTPDCTTVFVTNSGSNSISVIDTASLAVTSTLTTGRIPFGICISSDGVSAYVATLLDGLYKIDIATLAVTGPTTWTGMNDPNGICITSDDSTLYVANQAGGIQAIDTASMTPIGSLITFPIVSCEWLTITRDDAYLFTGGNTGGSTRVLDIATSAQITLTAPNGWGTAMTPDGTFAWIAGNGQQEMWPVALPSLTVGTPVPVPALSGTGLHCIAIDQGGANVYMPGSDHNVYVVDSPTQTYTSDFFATGNDPEDMCVGPISLSPIPPFTPLDVPPLYIPRKLSLEPTDLTIDWLKIQNWANDLWSATN